MIMEQPLNAKWVIGSEVLIAYLDLCGTKFFYKEFPLEQQKERIEQVVLSVEQELDEIFGHEQRSLYVHMYSDSLVAAEKEKDQIKDCATKLIQWLLQVQYQVLCNSQGLGDPIENNPSNKERYMPTLTRGLVRRGRYFGILFDKLGSSLGDTFINFSLVGGPTIVEMDKEDLPGLPMGTYIETAIIAESKIQQDRLVDVEGSQIKFVKPPSGFDFLRSRLPGGSPADFDAWIDVMIAASGDNGEFKSKLKPWSDAVQSRLPLIKRQQRGTS